MTTDIDNSFMFEVDSGFEDYDSSSAFDSDITSLLSSAKNHVFENGRRYHGYKEGKYMLPNDEIENNRLDLMHHVCLLALRGELFMAPVGNDSDPKKILDIGTGSGIWAVDFADQHPNAEVIGVDLSPVETSWVPPNLTFHVEDIEDVWLFPENTFDFIHLRSMVGSICDWQSFYRQAFKALKPGGWIEFQDFGDTYCTDDDSLPANSTLVTWVECWKEAMAIMGREWATVVPGTAMTLESVGYVDVVEKQIKVPMGPWPKEKSDKEIGIYWRQVLIDGVEGISLAPFVRILGWKKEELDEFLVGVHAALRNPKYHIYSKLYCIYGRKPDL